MKGSTGILLIAVGLIMLYVILSDKYQCFVAFVDCMTGADMATPKGYQPGNTGTLPTLPNTGGGFDPYKNNIFDLFNKVLGK